MSVRWPHFLRCTFKPEDSQLIFAFLAGGVLAQLITTSPPSVRAESIPVPAAVRAAYARGTRSTTGAPGSKYWQIWPEYELEGRLDPVQAVVLGSGTVSFVNASPDTLHEVVLRLDQNRFRSGASTNVRTRGIAIRRLDLDGVAVDLAGSAVSGLTTSVVRVRLPRPLASGARLIISSAWDYEVPLDETREALRQGRWGHDVFQIAQWYPRLAMYDDLGGWDMTAHDGSREFFNPFGTFRVTLHVPAGWLVGATGKLSNPEEVLGTIAQSRLSAAVRSDTTVFVMDVRERDGSFLLQGGGQRWRFEADSVSDFAWGASPQYAWVVTSRKTPAGRVLVHALFTQPHRGVFVPASSRAADIIANLSQRLMPYAWSTHTLVDGPEGGMEYPALTMSNGEILHHELAHQWFPMMVGSDETRFDFLDEGFATFLSGVTSGEVVARASIPTVVTEPLLIPDDLRTVRPVLGYGRGSRMLQALAARSGPERLLTALSAYALQWRFKHPSPWDFMAAMEVALAENLQAFWHEWLFARASSR